MYEIAIEYFDRDLKAKTWGVLVLRTQRDLKTVEKICQGAGLTYKIKEPKTDRPKKK